MWRSEGGATFEANLVALCARCHALVHEEFLFVSGVPGRWVFCDRRGRELGTQLPEVGAQLRMCAAAHDDATGKRTEPELTSLDDIPREIDVAWWRAHEHLLEWTPDGRGVRLQRRRSA